MSDLISRQATIKAIDDYTKGKPLYDYPWQIIEVIKSIPSAEKTGKWLKTGQSLVDPYKFRNFFCPICGFELDPHIRVAPSYCPNCGTRMEVE